MAYINKYTEKEMAGELIRALADMYICEGEGAESGDAEIEVHEVFFTVMGKLAEYLNLGLRFVGPDQDHEQKPAE